MGKRHRQWTPDQDYLLPQSPSDWLRVEHLVHFVLDLVRSGYLTSLPVDPFTGRAIVYRPRAGLLYCLGPDRVDSGGDRSDDAVAYLPFVKEPPTLVRKPSATRCQKARAPHWARCTGFSQWPLANTGSSAYAPAEAGTTNQRPVKAPHPPFDSRPTQGVPCQPVGGARENGLRGASRDGPGRKPATG